MAVTVEPIRLAVRYTTVEDGWVQAEVPGCPGLITCGRDRDEARAMACDALRELIRWLAQPHPVTEADANDEQLVVTVAIAGTTPDTTAP